MSVIEKLGVSYSNSVAILSLSIDERAFRVGYRMIHHRNNYNLNFFNGDIGTIREIDTGELTLLVAFFPDGRIVEYTRDTIPELDLADATTIHKSQGSENNRVRSCRDCISKAMRNVLQRSAQPLSNQMFDPGG